MYKYSVSVYCSQCGEKSASYTFMSPHNVVQINLAGVRDWVRYPDGRCQMCQFGFKKWREPRYEGRKW